MKPIVITENIGVGSRIAEAVTGAGLACSPSQVMSAATALEKLLVRESAETVVILDAIEQRESALQLIHKLVDVPQTIVIVVGREDNPGAILELIRGGAHDYIDAGSELQPQFAATLSRVDAKRQTRVNKGKLISIAAGSGGVGVSTLAVSMAALLAKQSGSCGLLDLHPTGGDLATLLQLTPRYSVMDLASKGESLDAAMLRQCLVRHESGIHLLAAPEPFRDQRQLPASLSKRMLTLATHEFPYLIADLENVFHPEQTQTVLDSDQVLLLFRLDIVSLLRTKKCLEYLIKRNVNLDRIHLVAARCGNTRDLSSAKVQKALGKPLAGSIPEDSRAILTAVNLGVPAVLECSESRAARAMTNLTSVVQGKHPQSTPAPTSFALRMFQAANSMLHSTSVAQ